MMEGSARGKTMPGVTLGYVGAVSGNSGFILVVLMLIELVVST